MKKKSGFTLIEILIAFFILAGGLVFLFNSFLMSWQALAYSRKLNEVSLLAQEKIEEIKAKKPVEYRQDSGQEGDLIWKTTTQDLQLADGVQVVLVQADIEFNFQNRPQKQRFLTYISVNE